MRMVTIPPRHYCTVANPVSRDAQGSVQCDVTGQVRLRHADLEIRLAQDPFPLYPGEVLEKVPGLPPPHPLCLSCHLVPGLSTTFWGGVGSGGDVGWFSLGAESTGWPSSHTPQTASPLTPAHAQTSLSCQPIPPPNLPGSPTCLKLPACLALSDFCQE